MLHFLHPLWLLAMTGISVPVVLHLWNDRSGKVLPVGSVFLLQGASRRMSLSRRLTKIWLLVLRCLVVVLLSLLLAGPFFRLEGGKPEKGWVLTAVAAGGRVTEARGSAGAGGSPAGSGADLTRSAAAGLPAGSSAAADGLPAAVDSLIKAGYTWHELRDTNYWEAFAQADREAPASVPFYIFTTGELIHFDGVHPETERPVHWTVLPVSGESHWIGKAWLASSDSVAVASGTGLATSTVFKHALHPVREEHDYDTTVHVVIGADRPEDARYLQSAIQAVGEYTRQKIDVSLFAGGSADWLFWLSTKPVPAGRFGCVFKYAVGREKKVDTWMEGVEVSKEIEGAPMGDGEPTNASRSRGSGGKGIWMDGFGRAVLAAAYASGDLRTGAGLRAAANDASDHAAATDTFRFYSRLDPTWNGLVWDPRFPVLLQELLFGQDPLDRQDRRVLDPEQITPTRKEARVVAVTYRDWDGGFLCWILLLLAFILERIVSFYYND